MLFADEEDIINFKESELFNNVMFRFFMISSVMNLNQFRTILLN